MNTFLHLWQCLAQVFLEWEMFQINVVEKIETHILYTVTFCFRKLCHLWDNVTKFGGTRRAKNVTIIHTRIVCWISKATCKHAHAHAHAAGHARTHARTHTHTHTHKSIYFLLFHGKNDSWTRLIFTLYIHFVSCCPYLQHTTEISMPPAGF